MCSSDLIEESLAVGLKAYNIDGTTSENTIIVIEPKLSETGEAVWNKIYVELTYEVSAYYNLNAVSYQIAFSSITSKPHAKLLIDNLKLLTSE